MEIWKAIPQYEGVYEVSNLGQVKCLERFVNGKGKGKKLVLEQIINPQIDKGYFRVNLYKNGKLKRIAVHRLVAIAFIPNQEEKPQVNHINGIKTDNRLENLEWVTLSENMIHAYKENLLVRKGEKHTQNKLSVSNVIEIRNLLSQGVKQDEIAKKYGVIRQTISCIKIGKSWNHI
jgi:DNA-binding XRE family transcriptional regulator